MYCTVYSVQPAHTASTYVCIYSQRMHVLRSLGGPSLQFTIDKWANIF